MPQDKTARPAGPADGGPVSPTAGRTAATPGHTPATPEHIFRRRRTGATIVVIALLALVAAALSSHGRRAGKRAHAGTRAHAGVEAAVGARHPLGAGGSPRSALELKAENRTIDSILAYTPAVVRGGGQGKEVALTFDDGPGPYTGQLVAALNRLRVHATFFTVGSQEQYFSAGTVQELASGDAVEDHSETHPMMSSLSPHDQYEQLFEPMARIELAGGPRPRLFRPPYGSFNATTFKELHHLRLLMVLWSVDTGDYARPGAEAIVQRALAGATPGAIILMHDAGGDRSQTIAALPKIVAELRKRGLEPVTVPRLLLDDPPPPGQRIPTSLTGG